MVDSEENYKFDLGVKGLKIVKIDPPFIPIKKTLAIKSSAYLHYYP